MFRLTYDNNEAIGIADYSGNQALLGSDGTLNESDPLVIKFRHWEQDNNLDLFAFHKRDRTLENFVVAQGRIGDGSSYTKRYSGLEPRIDPENNQQWQCTAGAGQVLDEDGVVRFIYFDTLQTFPIPSLLNGQEITNVYVYLYWNGTAVAVGFQEAAPISRSIKNKLFIGVIISSDGIIIDSVRPISLADDLETRDLLERGAINLDDAVIAPIPGTLRFSFSGGQFKFAGRNAYNDPLNPHLIDLSAQSEVNFIFCDPQGNVLDSTEDFNFSRYWDNDAVATATSDTATLYYLYLFPSGAIAAVLGENNYQDFVTLKYQANYQENHTIPPKFKNNTYFYGAIAGVVGVKDVGDRKFVSVLKNQLLVTG